MRLTLGLLAFAAVSAAQPSPPKAVPMPSPEIQYLDAAGKPLAGGKLCTYAAATDTPLATYTDPTAATANTNPVVLNTAGRASVWVGPQAYKFVLRTGGSAYPASDACTTGAIQWTQDYVSAIALSTCPGTSASTSTAQVCTQSTVAVCVPGLSINWTPYVTSGASPTLAAGGCTLPIDTNEGAAAPASLFTAGIPVALAVNAGGTAWVAGPIVPTATGSVATGSLAVGITSPNMVGVSTFYAQNYSGADPSIQINSCMADAIAHCGTCDARALGGTTPTSMSQEIKVGSIAQVGTAHCSVALLIPTSANWVWSKTDGTSCGIRQYGNTALIGQGPGGGGNRMFLDTANSSTSMDSLYCADATNSGGGEYIVAEGFHAENHGLATFANGQLHIQALFDNSVIQRVTGNNTVGDVWHVDYACCGSKFENIAGYGGAAASGYPLVLSAAVSVNFANSAFNGPGTGKNNIYINPAVNALQGVLFTNTYMEKTDVDMTTPAVYVNNFANNVSFVGGAISEGPSQITFENHTTAGFSVQNFFVNPLAPTAVNDVAFSRTWPTLSRPVISYSSNLGNFLQGLVSDSLTSGTYSAGSATHQNQMVAGAVTFTPTTTGWYRLIAAGGGGIFGTLDISGGWDGKISHLIVDVSLAPYGFSSSVTARVLEAFAGSTGVIDRIEASSDGGAGLYLDIHIATSISPTPLTIVYYGQSISAASIVTSPVVGATPGGSSIANLNLGALSTSNIPSFVTTGPVSASGGTSIMYRCTSGLLSGFYTSTPDGATNCTTSVAAGFLSQ